MWLRNCKKCLDVARMCPLDVNCPYLKNRLKDMLLKNFATEAPQPRDILRFIEEQAIQGDVRAVQVSKHGLKPDNPAVYAVTRQHAVLLKVQEWMEAKHQEVSLEDAAAFLRDIWGGTVDLNFSYEAKKLCRGLKLLVDFREKLDDEVVEDGKQKGLHGDDTKAEKFLEAQKHVELSEKREHLIVLQLYCRRQRT